MSIPLLNTDSAEATRRTREGIEFFFPRAKSVEEGAGPGGGGSACVTGWPDQRTAHSSP